MSDLPKRDILTVQAEARAVVQAAEEAWESQQPSRLIAALQECDRVLQALPVETLLYEAQAPDPNDALAKERAFLWLWRGRLLIKADDLQVVVQGIQSLDQALARLRAAGRQPWAQEALAAAWMSRGSGLFRLESREALAEAVRSYDQAILLLEGAPEATRSALGVAWMNRGIGVMNLELVSEAPEATAARLADAAQSLERAIAVLEPLAATQRAAQHNLSSTWSNLGQLRSRQNDAAGAVAAHRQAVDLFRPLAALAGDTGETYELAARLYNLGQACNLAGDPREALATGREALVHAAMVETNDPQALELVLCIRHAVCVVLGGQLAAGRAGDTDRAERLEEAGDLVEEGLAAVRDRGVSSEGVTAASARLYEFGAWFYRTQQPHFLGEFLLEHLGEDKMRAQIAAAAVQAARQTLVSRSFNDTTHGTLNRVLDILQDLGAVEARLKALGS